MKLESVESVETRRAREQAKAAAAAAEAQRRVLELTGTLTTRRDLRELAQQFRELVDRIPLVAVGDSHLWDGMAHRLSSLADTGPLADTSAGPWTTLRAHFHGRQPAPVGRYDP